MKKIVLVLLAVSLIMNAGLFGLVVLLNNNFNDFRTDSKEETAALKQADIDLNAKVEKFDADFSQRAEETESRLQKRDDGLSRDIGDVISFAEYLEKKLADAESTSQKSDAALEKKFNESDKLLLQKLNSVDGASKGRDEVLNGEIKNISGKMFDAAEIFAKSLQSVVIIKIDGEQNGGGLVYGKPNIIVTNFHVVAGYNQESITIRYFNGLEVPAKVVASSEETDLALLEVADSGLAPLVPASSISVGEPIAVLGHPYQFTYTLSVGVVSAVNRQLDLPNITEVQIDTPVAPGSSGSPVFNRNGEVIGLVNRMGGSFGFIVPIWYVDALLKGMPQ